MDVRRGCLVSFTVTLPYFHSLIELGAKLPDTKTQKSSCVHPFPPVVGSQAHMFTPSFSCGFWSFELRFSCLWGKHSYPVSYPPQFHYISRNWIAGSHVNSVFCLLKYLWVLCIGAEQFYMLTNFCMLASCMRNVFICFSKIHIPFLIGSFVFLTLHLLSSLYIL